MLPPAMLGIIIGMKSGEILSAPSSSITLVWVTNVFIPPMPVPTYTPNLSGAIFSPDTSELETIVWEAAARAYWL